MTPDKENPQHSPAIRQLTPTNMDAHLLAIDLADAAFLHDAGTEGLTAEGLTAEGLKQKWQVAYQLGRNGVEHALGAAEPYAENRTQDLRRENQ
jgi:hypothetical protein